MHALAYTPHKLTSYFCIVKLFVQIGKETIVFFRIQYDYISSRLLLLFAGARYSRHNRVAREILYQANI